MLFLKNKSSSDFRPNELIWLKSRYLVKKSVIKGIAWIGSMLG
jgi:hypothetical protein